MPKNGKKKKSFLLYIFSMKYFSLLVAVLSPTFSKSAYQQHKK